MRRIKVEHRVWLSDAADCSGTIMATRDYRLLLRVARAAEAYASRKRIKKGYSEWGLLLSTLDAINAKPRKP